jgi:protein ImuA
VLWCLTRQDLFAPALAQAGLMPDRVIYVEAGDEKSVLICFEEGLRHGGLGAVVAEVARLSMTASRRLQLPKARAPSASPSAAGGGRQRRQISASRRPPSPAGASARSPRNSLAGARRRPRPLAARIDPVPRRGKCRFRSDGLRCQGSSRSSFRPGPRREGYWAAPRLRLRRRLAIKKIRTAGILTPLTPGPLRSV